MPNKELQMEWYVQNIVSFFSSMEIPQFKKDIKYSLMILSHCFIAFLRLWVLSLKKNKKRMKEY